MIVFMILISYLCSTDIINKKEARKSSIFYYFPYWYSWVVYLSNQWFWSFNLMLFVIIKWCRCSIYIIPIEDPYRQNGKTNIRKRTTQHNKEVPNRTGDIIWRSAEIQISSTHNATCNTCASKLLCILIIKLAYNTYNCIINLVQIPGKMSAVTWLILITHM